METNLFNLDELPGSDSSNVMVRLLLIVALAIGAHFLVWLVRRISDWLVTAHELKKRPVSFVTQQPKFITLTGLIASALTFVIYSIALGFILHVFGVNSQKFLTTYLATASVIGLAVGFGSQGLVQDVVTGLTLIFSDTLDVGDLIEVSGQTGRVQHVGLRFTELRNFLNQQVFIPNRMIANIARFPSGGVQAYADIQLPSGVDSKAAIDLIGRIVLGTWKQFGTIILEEPSAAEMETVETAGWSFLRVRFKIWPGQGAVLETAFRQRIVHAMRTFQPEYADWMVSITYRGYSKVQRAEMFSI